MTNASASVGHRVVVQGDFINQELHGRRSLEIAARMRAMPGRIM
jgi:hypothetical protein